MRNFGDGRAAGVYGLGRYRLEWNAVVTRAVHPQPLCWRTDAGSSVQHAGSVQFEPFNGETRVSVKMSYNAGAGLGHALAALLGSDPKQQMDDDLARMKVFIERSVPPHDAARAETAATSSLH